MIALILKRPYLWNWNLFNFSTQLQTFFLKLAYQTAELRLVV